MQPNQKRIIINSEKTKSFSKAGWTKRRDTKIFIPSCAIISKMIDPVQDFEVDIVPLLLRLASWTWPSSPPLSWEALFEYLRKRVDRSLRRGLSFLLCMGFRALIMY